MPCYLVKSFNVIYQLQKRPQCWHTSKIGHGVKGGMEQNGCTDYLAQTYS